MSNYPEDYYDYIDRIESLEKKQLALETEDELYDRSEI